MGVGRWLRIVGLRLRSVLRRGEVERELDEELAYHIAMQTEKNLRRGMAPAEARRAALRAFGGVDLQKEAAREVRGTRLLEETAGDVALALRSARRAPGFTTTVVLTLALGIGANTAMFTLLHGTLLKPLPHRDGDRLVYLRQSAEGAGQSNVLFSVPEVEDLRAGSQALGEIAEYSTLLPFKLVVDGEASRVRTGIVSGNYFDVLGLAPVLGRVLADRDDGPAADPVLVLAHAFWQSRFGGDTAVIGRAVQLNDLAGTIVGVVEPAPQHAGRPEVFVNMVSSPHHLSATMVTERVHRMTEVFARLAPGATVEQARAEVERLAAGMREAHPEAYEAAARFEVELSPLRDALNERASLTFWLLMAAAAFVLLIACANVANLTLMRGIGREREMVVRTSLGARRGRLRRQLLAENLLLAAAGGTLGVLLALAGLELLQAFAAQLSPRAGEIGMGRAVLGVALATVLATATGLSFVPRLGAGGGGALASSLAPSGGRATRGRGRQRLQRGLVIAQLAICTVLLTGAGLLARTLAKLDAVASGVSGAEQVLTVELPADGPIDETIVLRRAELLERYERIRARVAALPGVRVASVGAVAPLRRPLLSLDLRAENRVVPPDQPTPHAVSKPVDPAYFAAAGIPILAGRGFAPGDRDGAPRVVVLNASLARRLFGDEDPLGRRVAWTGEVLRFTPFSADWRTVVGVVGDTRDHGPDSGPVATVYHPFAQEPVFGADLVIRTGVEPATLAPSITGAIRELYPDQVIDAVATLAEIRDATVAPRRLNALFIGSFSVLALVIATIGIAGTLAFSARSRTAEIGIRMSIGARPGDVRSMVLREGGLLLLVGLGLGIGGALGGARLLGGLLWGVEPHDPLTLASVAALLAAAGLAACWLPAARAARIDPAVALRAE